MSSVKKTEKSRKAKASVARAAVKTGRSATKQKPSASKAHAARTTARRAAKTSTRTTKTKAPAKTATPRSKSAASKLRAAQARLKKQAAAAKASRPAAKATATKSSTAKSSAAKGGAKATQLARGTKINRSTVERRGKSRTGRSTPTELKMTHAAVIEKKPAALHAERQAVAKPIVPERRAQAAAVLALRSQQKPAQAAAPVARAHEASKASVIQKVAKKTPEAAQRPAPSTAPIARPAPGTAAPVKPAAPTGEVKPAAPAKPAAPVKHGFKPLEFVVYPAHGVGQILAVEEQEVAGFKLELFVISFSKDKMILKVPTPKSIAVGMRKLASAEVVNQALTTLTGRARIKRTMWSRRAQEYEAKINSGDLVAIAEVVRDLYRSEAQPEQSYSERQLYEAALDRVAREFAAVQKLTETESLKVIETQLQKSPRRGKVEDSEGDAEAEDATEREDGGINEAA